MFHVTTHAFFKALLFLAAGSVIHALGGEQDIRKMGGLKGHIKITYITFLIGTLAISGLPLMSGFFSKDLILAHAFQESPAVFVLLLFGALLTTFYMFRLLFLVFFGKYRGSAHPHESPLTMTVPLMVLAVLSVVGGLLNVPHLFGGHEGMKHFLETAAEGIHYEHIELSATTEWILMGITTVLVLATIFFAYRRFAIPAQGRNDILLDGEEADMPFFKRLIAQRWRFDELYRALFEKPYSWISTRLHSIGEHGIMVPLQNGVGEGALRIGNVVRKLQTGNASFHLLAMTAGLIIFLIITLLSN